ncbi:MAG TPA: low molecular weight protein-tyrosine-phosphatase [Longimicrobiales bacterium]|nr:low molecular weight protein-tyrosine-phosphatase [Longimicrobiales bacterium]
MDSSRVRVLFVCMGNICRSPLAEAVFHDLVTRARLSDRISIESAGIGSWHVGELPDPRTRSVAEKRGLRLTSRARQVEFDDLDRFHLVIAMDEENVRGLERIRAQAAPGAEVRRLREFDPQADELDVPDPYYGGDDGFERVHDMIERACEGLLEHIRETRL